MTGLFVQTHSGAQFLSLLVSMGVSLSGTGAGRRYLPDRNIRPALKQMGGHGDLFAFELSICL